LNDTGKKQKLRKEKEEKLKLEKNNH